MVMESTSRMIPSRTENTRADRHTFGHPIETRPPPSTFTAAAQVRIDSEVSGLAVAAGCKGVRACCANPSGHPRMQRPKKAAANELKRREKREQESSIWTRAVKLGISRSPTKLNCALVITCVKRKGSVLPC